jgi:hypothetical protein
MQRAASVSVKARAEAAMVVVADLNMAATAGGRKAATRVEADMAIKVDEIWVLDATKASAHNALMVTMQQTWNLMATVITSGAIVDADAAAKTAINSHQASISKDADQAPCRVMQWSRRTITMQHLRPCLG